MVYKLAVGSLLPLGSIVLLSVLLVPWLVFYLLGDAYIVGTNLIAPFV